MLILVCLCTAGITIENGIAFTRLRCAERLRAMAIAPIAIATTDLEEVSTLDTNVILSLFEPVRAARMCPCSPVHMVVSCNLR